MGLVIEFDVEYPATTPDGEGFALGGGLFQLEDEDAEILHGLAAQSEMTPEAYVQHALLYAINNVLVFHKYEQCMATEWASM